MDSGVTEEEKEKEELKTRGFLWVDLKTGWCTRHDDETVTEVVADLSENKKNLGATKFSMRRADSDYGTIS